FFVGEKLFLPHAVVTSLLIFIDLFFVPQPLQHFLYTFLVQRIGRCCPGVITHIEFVPQRDELFGDSRDKLLRRHSFFLGRLLNLLPVLIDAGKKKYVIAFQPAISRDDIGENFFIGMANVRRRIGVIDRSGDEKR